MKSISRQLQWVSSVTGDPAVLVELNERMSWFYGQMDGRELYQTMLNAQENDAPLESVRHSLPRYIADSGACDILEIGCGNGRLYRQLRSYGYSGQYTGVEVAQYVINGNKEKHPEAEWRAALAYDIPFPTSSFDLCFSLYVLEHFVYPERALVEMMRVLKPNGCLVLVFPDFAASGRFPSQLFGFSPGRATDKIKRGRWLDLVVSLYDSRVRLPKALREASKNFGPFPVNTAPFCLYYPDVMGADIDAVYIASKTEIHEWSSEQGYEIEYPCGTEGDYKLHAFLVIKKP